MLRGVPACSDLDCASAPIRPHREWLPQADWVLLDGCGHAPQLDGPLETAQLVLGRTGI